MVNIRTFDLNLLRVLAALLETKSVSRAARLLGLSQPAVSNALSRLRNAFGDPLLVRQGHIMQPTPLAQTLQPRVHGLLDDISTALAVQTGFDPDADDRRFRILANDYATATVLAPFIALKARKGWKPMLEVLPFEDRFLPRLRDEDYDLAIRDDWALREWPHRQAVARDHLTGLARRDHPRIGAAPTMAQFLAERHILISPSGQTTGLVDSHLRQAGLSRRIDLYLPHILAAPAIVAASDLVMCLSHTLAIQFENSHAVRIFHPPLPRFDFEMSMAWSPRKARDPALAWLKDALRLAVQEASTTR